MLNDPYLEIIQKVKSLNLPDTIVEESVNIYLKEGVAATKTYLMDNKKINQQDAGVLLSAIKNELRSTYYANTLYSGIFMFLFIFTSVTFYVVSHRINFWFYFFLVPGLLSAYLFSRSLRRAKRI